MTITSKAFPSGDSIPDKYGRAFDDINPPLTFDDIPADAESLALIMDDPDAPGATFTHWVVYNITPASAQIAESELPAGAVEGLNDYGEKGYGGPKPPTGTHRYFFKLFVLDTKLSIASGATAEEVREAMRDHILYKAELVGTFSAS
jgi:Raf kinase inhibitor-like YbhB/YbcL family protein